ncbi:rod shape-determining protein MreC [Armatimonas sp.]|uniref:rod shape-determining protein MreC n=1 Tax=Armatimonas sp. TaxID=1872638 RepID=UPI0037537600
MRRKRLSGGWNPRVERRGFKIAWGTIVGLLIVGGVVLGVLHNRLQSQGKADPVLLGAQLIAGPAEVAAARTNQSVNTTWRGLFGGVALERENRQLKEKLAGLQLETERLTSVEAQNERLQQLLAFTAPKSPKPMVAEVIAWLPTALEQSITLGRGSRDGVVRDQVVRTAEGLLGKITDVGLFTAKVRLLTDTDSGVGATVGGGAAYGILRGVEQGNNKLDRRHALDLVHLERTVTIKPGDIVSTSGEGGIFPPGIPIGTVETVQEDATHLLKIARVKPYNPMPGMVREVLILPIPKLLPTAKQEVGRP